jgi:phosphocarrier protein HPr
VNKKSESVLIVRDFVILNQYGVHARPAALFVKTASRYDSDIYVEKDGSKVSGKSIMGLMTLEASKGSKIRVSAEGVDAEEAIKDLDRKQV